MVGGYLVYQAVNQSPGYSAGEPQPQPEPIGGPAGSPAVTPTVAPPPPPPPPVIVHQSTDRVVNSWSDTTTWSASGYRHVRVDQWTQVMADTYQLWSDGSEWSSGWYQESITDNWYEWWVKLVDPARIDETVDAGSVGLAGIAGLIDGAWADDGISGRCGLNGTTTSCLAEAYFAPVGAGCAGVDAGIGGGTCAPSAPVAGLPNGQGEAVSTPDLDAAATAPDEAPATDAGGAGRKPPSPPSSDSCTPDPDDDEVDPNLINFSQRSAAPNNYAELMRTDEWDWKRPGTALRVIDRGGPLVSYDNRRLDAAREVRATNPDYRVRVIRVDPNVQNPEKTTNMTWDESFEQRMRLGINRDENGCRVPWQGLSGRPEIRQTKKKR